MVNSRRLGGALLALACAAGLGWLYHHATDFPAGPPFVTRVDAALVAHLRANPEMHMALAEDAVFEVPLDLRDDAFNRWFYGTDIDRREAVARGCIHVQRKNGRMAIHADGWNPVGAGVSAKLVHGIVDVPAIPLALGLLVGTGLAARRRPTRDRA